MSNNRIKGVTYRGHLYFPVAPNSRFTNPSGRIRRRKK